MPLTLVLGPANSAKAGEVLGAYALAARRDALLVVPTAADVSHYERELAAPGVTLGRALTFPGLIEEIAFRAGHRGGRLTPLQRDRVVRRAIAAVRLESLAGSAAGNGFAPAAVRLIAELEQRRVTPQRFTAALREWAGGATSRVAFCRDIAAIYRRYRDELAVLDMVDAELFAWGALDALRERPPSWGGTPVFLYGFDDLTPIEIDAVETLSRLAGVETTVSLTYEPGRPALAARATVVEDLRAVAQSVTQLPALDDHYSPGSRSALHQLERNLFEPGPPVVEPGEAVTLMEAGGERAEAELVAAEVLQALAAGVPAHEIVVVCRSLAGSGELFERALNRMGIAATSARQLPLEHTALGRALLGLVRFALSRPEQRAVRDLIAYLRHPGVVASIDAVDELEAELRRAGVANVAGSLAGPGGPGGPGGSGGSGADALRPAFELLERLRATADPGVALPDQVSRLLAAPHRGTASLLTGAQELDARAASTVIEALMQLRQLNEGPLAAADMIELLEGLRVQAHGLPPAGAVLVAEPLAIRARRFRRVFVTGLCEGEFPSPQTAAGDPFLGDERRREVALATGLVLPQSTDPLDRERYLLYACVSRATERVSFSYRSSDEDGNLVIASPFLDDIAELFPGDWRQRRRRRLLADVVWSPEDAPNERERTLAEAFTAGVAADASHSAEPETGVGIGDIDPARVLSEAALAHVRHRRIVSAGALESFGACPVKWLVERQLSLRDLEPDPEPLARGAFIHAVLERVFARLDGALNPSSAAGAEELLRTEIRSSALVADRVRVAAGQAPEVRAAVLRGIEAELRRYLIEEAADGCEFVPVRTELRFGLEPDSPTDEADAPEGDPGGSEAFAPVELDDGSEQVLLSGIVDRVDVDPADARRVIVRDYKSGARRDSWPAAHWLEDRQIQVALYMIAVQRLLGVRAVAGFYQPLAGEDRRPRGALATGTAAGGRVVVRDELGEGELEQLLDQIEAEAVALAATLRRGELTPCPDTCSVNGTCSHPGICWADELAPARQPVER